jgi:hypothetical protein
VAAARLGVTEKNSYIGYTGVANLLGERENSDVFSDIYLTSKQTFQRVPSRDFRRQKAGSKAK